MNKNKSQLIMLHLKKQTPNNWILTINDSQCVKGAVACPIEPSLRPLRHAHCASYGSCVTSVTSVALDGNPALTFTHLITKTIGY